MTDRELMQQALEALLEVNYDQAYAKEVAALRERLAQPDQWQGLTDEEIEFIYADTGYNDIQMFARAIEAKLKEKNG